MGKAASAGHPADNDNRNMDAVENGRRRSDHRMMRSGKAEYAMRASGLIGIAGRQLRRSLDSRRGVVQTKLEGRRAFAGMSGRAKPPSAISRLCAATA